MAASRHDVAIDLFLDLWRGFEDVKLRRSEGGILGFLRANASEL